MALKYIGRYLLVYIVSKPILYYSVKIRWGLKWWRSLSSSINAYKIDFSMPKLLPKSRIYNTQKCALKIKKSCNLGRQYEKIGIESRRQDL